MLNTLEGDPRFFFDDSQTPQAQGTGTEEWGGGGDYWGGENMTLPFAGHPVGAQNAEDAQDDEDKIESAYRFLLADLMPFGKNALIQLEHGGTNESTEHYETVTYWYGLPAPSLVQTDELKIGDAASEKRPRLRLRRTPRRRTRSPRATNGAWTRCRGRKSIRLKPTRGRTTKTALGIHAANRSAQLGVMLRRKLDYRFPNQRAEVFVADGGSRQAANGSRRASGISRARTLPCFPTLRENWARRNTSSRPPIADSGTTNFCCRCADRRAASRFAFA